MVEMMRKIAILIAFVMPADRKLSTLLSLQLVSKHSVLPIELLAFGRIPMQRSMHTWPEVGDFLGGDRNT